MNGSYYKDPLEESYDDDLFDEEAVGTTAEFNPLGAVSSTIGGLLGGGRRPPVRHRDHRTFPAPGVKDARLETPRGTANLRLPEEVVSKRVFDDTTRNLQESITRVTARINGLEQNDIPKLKQEVGAVMANTRQAIADEKKARRKAMIRQARALKSMQTTNLMMSLLFQRQLQRQLESHTHPGNGQVPNGSTADPASLSGSDNNTLLFLPMMMMGEGGMGVGGSDKEGDNGDSYRESGSDNMMMMVMMMTLLSGK